MNCKEGVQELIDQIVDTIQIIPPADFGKPMEIFNGSTLGKHFRHIHDFFSCLVEQCHQESLDYAHRLRDPDLESQKDVALSAFRALKPRLAELDEDRSISVYADFQLEEGKRPRVNTTFGRELMYGYDHAVHHLAIVKIGLKSLDPTLPIHDELGVAASTIKHQHAISHGH